MTTYRSDFDNLFQSAAATYLSDWQGVAWKWLKSEATAESNLDPNAWASDGGMGIAQFEPSTWYQIADELHFPRLEQPGIPELPKWAATAFSPAYAIPGMAYYLSTLWDQWSSPRPWFDRLQLTQASYNAGTGNILKAQRLAGGALDYDSIIAQLPKVTGQHNAAITTAYVERIHSIYQELTA